MIMGKDIKDIAGAKLYLENTEEHYYQVIYPRQFQPFDYLMR